MQNNLTPKVSVLMPAYNSERYIAEAIGSILNQTYRNLELVIVNDASTDSTLDIIKQFSRNDDRIKYIDLPKNVGTNKAKNIALDNAFGKYIAILDSDDIAIADRLQKQVTYLDTHKDIFLVGGAVKIINEFGQETGISRPITDIKKLKISITKKNCIYHPTVMYRNSGIRYRDVPYGAEDYDLYLRILSEGKMVENLPDYLCYYRVISTSLSRKKAGQIALASEFVRTMYFERLKTGQDSFQNIDWSEIEKIKLPTKNKLFVYGEIEALFKLRKYADVLKVVYGQIRIKSFSLKLFVFLIFAIFDGFLYKIYKRFN